jgi:hypothetical protein
MSLRHINSAFFSLVWVCKALCLLLITSTARPQTIGVTDSVGNTVLWIENGKISDAATHALHYTVKGNLIFHGDSESRHNILYMLNRPDIFSKKPAHLIIKKTDQPLLTTLKGKIFLGSAPYQDALMIGWLQKTDSSVVLLQAEKSKPVFEIRSNQIPAAQVLAVVTIFLSKYKIDQAIVDSLNARARMQPRQPGTGSIRRLWSSSGNEDFVWDGTIVRNRWNFNDYECWIFDGTTLKRAYFDTGEDLIWDGKILKRKWINDNAYFVVEGNSIRRVFGDLQDEFYIQGNIVRRAFTTFGSDEWEINGDIPLPVVILVVFRMVR